MPAAVPLCVMPAAVPLCVLPAAVLLYIIPVTVPLCTISGIVLLPSMSAGRVWITLLFISSINLYNKLTFLVIEPSMGYPSGSVCLPTAVVGMRTSCFGTKIVLLTMSVLSVSWENTLMKSCFVIPSLLCRSATAVQSVFRVEVWPSSSWGVLGVLVLCGEVYEACGDGCVACDAGCSAASCRCVMSPETTPSTRPITRRSL